MLAKPDLKDGWIDTSVGEAHLVRDILLRSFYLDPIKLSVSDHLWDYPKPNGYPPLVSFLEERYKHPVVITNGAKQALGSVCYAFKRMKKKTVGLSSIYWALIPPMIEMHGLKTIFGKHPFLSDAYLTVAPSNPDGFMPDLDCLQTVCQSKNIPMAHDGAYYTHAYLPVTQELKVYGDAQIFSISKMFGLSGLRLGFVVCPNPEMYRFIQEYMEASTVGVSVVSQMVLMDLLTQMKKDPVRALQFHQDSYDALRVNKEALLNISSDILDINTKMVEVPGMFLWARCQDWEAFHKAKIHIIDGEHFGAPGYIRMNLSLKHSQILEIIKRLNNTRIK